MPKMTCKCGYIINYSQIPSENDWLFISEIEYDKFQGKVDSEEIYRSMRLMRRCTNCGRLYIYWNGANNDPEIFVKDI